MYLGTIALVWSSSFLPEYLLLDVVGLHSKECPLSFEVVHGSSITPLSTYLQLVIVAANMKWILAKLLIP